MPSFEISKTGSEQGTEKDTGLVMTPKDAVAAYADVLQNGASSQYAQKFADDDLRTKLADLTEQVQKAMELNEGSQQQVFTPVDDAISVMRSADGGDLVVAQINSEWTRSAGSGRESQPASDAEKALFGDGQATSTMKTTYVNVVALYVPPANSDAKITQSVPSASRFVLRHCDRGSRTNARKLGANVCNVCCAGRLMLLIVDI